MSEQQADVSAQRVTYRVEEETHHYRWTPGETPAIRPSCSCTAAAKTRFAWGSTARTLAEHGWYAVSLDLRGHGESGWAPDGKL